MVVVNLGLEIKVLASCYFLHPEWFSFFGSTFIAKTVLLSLTALPSGKNRALLVLRIGLRRKQVIVTAVYFKNSIFPVISGL